jgi:hypothetical protein
LIVLCLAQFMLILDVAVVAVAVPSIQDDLGVAPADLQWISTAYADLLTNPAKHGCRHDERDSKAVKVPR